jgi:hypothetical protein
MRLMRRLICLVRGHVIGPDSEYCKRCGKNPRYYEQPYD